MRAHRSDRAPRAAARRSTAAGLLAVVVLAAPGAALAAMLPAPATPQTPATPQAVEALPGSVWVGEVLTPAPADSPVGEDPLHLDPRAEAALRDWLRRTPGADDQPSASVRNLFPDLPLHPAFPGHGLSFEPKPAERLALPPEGLDRPQSGAGGRSWEQAGKGWLMEHADASEIAEVKAWRSWVLANRVPLVLLAATLAIIMLGLAARGARGGGRAGGASSTRGAGRDRTERTGGAVSRPSASHGASPAGDRTAVSTAATEGRPARRGSSSAARTHQHGGRSRSLARAEAESDFDPVSGVELPARGWRRAPDTRPPEASRPAAAASDPGPSTWPDSASAHSGFPSSQFDPSLRVKRHRGSGRSRSRRR